MQTRTSHHACFDSLLRPFETIHIARTACFKGRVDRELKFITFCRWEGFESDEAFERRLWTSKRVNQTYTSSPNISFYHPFLEMGSRISAVKRNDHNDNRQGVYKSLNISPEEDRARDLARPEKLDILFDRPSLPEEALLGHAWNPNDRSVNIFVKEDDPHTFHRHPVAQSTDCIRGKKGYSRGFHVWEIQWSTRQRGTHAVVGVATSKAVLHCTGYQSLVGSNEESWGWDIVRNKLYHNEKNISAVKYPVLSDNDHNFVVPDKFRVILDMDEGTMAFETNDGRYLGVAFRGIKGKTVFPIVSAVWGHCEITMKYIGGLDRKWQFFALYVICVTPFVSCVNADLLFTMGCIVLKPLKHNFVFLRHFSC